MAHVCGVSWLASACVLYMTLYLIVSLYMYNVMYVSTKFVSKPLYPVPGSLPGTVVVYAAATMRSAWDYSRGKVAPYNVMYYM